jgi:hypothetical protein
MTVKSSRSAAPTFAVQHFANVERDVDLGEGQPFRPALLVSRLDLFQALHGIVTAVRACGGVGGRVAPRG